MTKNFKLDVLGKDKRFRFWLLGRMQADCKIKAGKWIVWIVCGVVVKARSGKALLVLPELAYDLGGRID